ncbi:MAG: VanZ family protein [Bacteroidetes bacterium]|nr:VanZ family protein [Bacteroidota bacterium]
MLNDKFAHVLLFVILTFIWLLYYFISNKKGKIIKNMLRVLLLCFIYGIIIETIQYLLIASRQADLLDILANAIGIFIGAIVFWQVRNRIKT